MRRQGGARSCLGRLRHMGRETGRRLFLRPEGRTAGQRRQNACTGGGVVILLKYGHILPHFSRTEKAANCGKKEHSHTTRVAKFRFSIETRVSMCYVLTEAAVYGRENEC